MGKIYKIRIDSEIYEVEIEEVIKDKAHKVTKEAKTPEKSNITEPTQSQKESAETKQEEKPAIREETKEEVLENGVEFILAPLPGKVLKVMVKPGDFVKKGDVLLTIEAMKMENEIFAGFDARVVEVYVNPGDKVETNKKLLKLAR